MARTLVLDGYQVTVITATPLAGLSERDDGFATCRNTSFWTLLRHIGSADALIINGGLSVPAAFAAWLRGKPFAVWHQMAGAAGLNGEPVVQRIRSWIAAGLGKQASIHVGVSEACLASKHLPAGSRRAVIFNPVAPELEMQAKRRLPNPKNIDVLFVGRLFEGKGIFVLAEALTRLGAAGKFICATFVGVGPDETKLRSVLSGQLNVRAEFLGGLTTKELAEVYPRARCLAVPSTTHPEGLPLVIAEALSFGVPVVGSDQPAIAEAIGDAGLICPQGDSAALALALSTLLEDRMAAGQLTQQALRRAELFSSSKFGDAVQQLVAEIIKG